MQSIKQECLDYFVVFGQRHMDYLCREFVEHYHAERPHQGLDNELPSAAPPRRENGSPTWFLWPTSAAALASAACSSTIIRKAA